MPWSAETLQNPHSVVLSSTVPLKRFAAIVCPLLLQILILQAIYLQVCVSGQCSSPSIGIAQAPFNKPLVIVSMNAPCHDDAVLPGMEGH